jgi:antirestriction protein ArdC
MDINQIITDKIINLLERGTVKTGARWTGSKATGLPVNAKSGEQYHGINVLVLWAEMADKSYASSQWLTFKQAADLGANVRKGEKSVMCVYYRTVGQRDEAKAEDEQETYFMAKPFWLFNVAQIDGLPADLTTTASATPAKSFNQHQEAEQLLRNSQASIHYGFDSAYYSPSADKICLPARERFTSESNFYATALHELSHWTGSETRLNRSFGKRFGDDAYAFEELVAELGAAFTVGQLGMIDATIEAHADYVQSWIKVLKGDKKAIFTAASQAAKASDFILNQEASVSRLKTAIN